MEISSTSPLSHKNLSNSDKNDFMEGDKSNQGIAVNKNSRKIHWVSDLSYDGKDKKMRLKLSE